MATMAIAETVDSDGVQIEFLVEFQLLLLKSFLNCL